MSDFDAKIFGASLDVEKSKLQIIEKTLDRLNENGSSKSKAKTSMESSYNFQKEVLSSVYDDKGAIINTVK